MDSLEAEQIRGITMKSSAVALFYNPTIQFNRQITPEVAASDPNSYLINLIDSPGHVDFASDVSTAVRLCDCALIVVDVVEGVCPQTRAVLKEAWNERLTLILVLNKVDRFFVQLGLNPLQVYDRIQWLLEQVNSVLAELFTADVMQRRVSDTSQSTEGTYMWSTGLESRDDSHVYFSPNQSNVIFTSAVDSWGFRISDFADFWSERMKLPKKGLLKALWGDFYFVPSSDGGPPRVKSNARAKNKKPIFVQLIIDHLYHIYKANTHDLFKILLVTIILDENRDAAGHIAERLGVKLELRFLQQQHTMDNRGVLRSILGSWLPLGPAVFRSLVEVCPSPLNAITPHRAKYMLFGESSSSENLLLSDASENGAIGVEEDNISEAFPALNALQKCSSSADAPVIIFVSKVFCCDAQKDAVSTVVYPKGGNRRVQSSKDSGSPSISSNSSSKSIKTTSFSSDQAEVGPRLSDSVPSTEFVALSRIYSGRVKVGLRLFVLGPKFDGSNIPDCLLDANPSDLPVGPLRIPGNAEEEEDLRSPSESRRRSVSSSSVSSTSSDTGSMETHYAGYDDCFVRHAYVGEITDVVQFCGGQNNVIRLKKVKYPDDSISAGNVVGLVGASIVNNLPKSGLLVSSLRMVTASVECESESRRRIQPLGGLAIWQGDPVISLAIEPVSTTESDRLLLEQGLKLLERSDPCAEVTFTSKGECLLHAAGEIHMQKCLEDLTKYFAPELEIHTSPLVVPFRETVIQSCPPAAYSPFDSLAFAKAQLERELKLKNLVYDEARENCVRRGDADMASTSQQADQQSCSVETSDPTPFLPVGILQLPQGKLRTRIFMRVTAHPIPEDLLKWLESRGAAYVKVILRNVKRKSCSRRAVICLKKFEEEFAAQLDAIPPESCVDLDWRSLKSRLLCLGPQQVGANLLFSRLRSGLFRLDTAWGKPMPPWSDENDPPPTPNEGRASLIPFLSYSKAILRGFQIATEQGPLCAEPLRGIAFVLEEIYAEDRMQLPTPRVLTAADLLAEDANNIAEETNDAENNTEGKSDKPTVGKDEEEDDPILAKLRAKQAAIDKRQKSADPVASMSWLISDDDSNGENNDDDDGDYDYNDYLDDDWNPDGDDEGSDRSGSEKEEETTDPEEEEAQVVESEKKLTVSDHYYWQRRNDNDWLPQLKPELLTTVMNRACKAAFMACPAQRLVLSMYDVELLCRSFGLGRMYAVLRKRCARIVSEDMREGEECFVINARLPVVESFGLTDDLRRRTSGQVSLPQLRPGGWEVLDIDPLQRDANGRIAVLDETHIKIWQRQQEAIKKLRLSTEILEVAGKTDARPSSPVPDSDSDDSQVEEELAKDELVTDLNRIRTYLRDVRKRKGLPINEQLVVEVTALIILLGAFRFQPSKFDSRLDRSAIFMDLSGEMIDHEADLFYDSVRTFVVVFLTVAGLLPTSYLLITSRRKDKEAYMSKNDITVQNFVLVVCVVTISLCIIMVFMLLLSILANEVLIISPDRYYVQWINAASHSVHKGSKGISSRCFYSILYVAVTYTALFGSLTLFISSVLDMLNSSNFTSNGSSLFNLLPRACFSSPLFYYSWPLQFLGDLICCIDSTLLFTQQSLSYTGLALLLSQRPPSGNIYHTQAIDEEYRIQLEKCLKYIKALNKPFLQPENQLSHQIVSHSDSSYQLSPEGTSESLELSEALSRTPFSVIYAILFVLLLVVFLASAICASLNVIVMLWSLLLSRGEETADHSFVSDYILLGHESVSKFGFIGACLQALMVTFVIFTSVIGFYSLPLVSKYIYPQCHGTTMTLLLLNATCILAMSSAVPLHASLLGLVTPSFPPVYYSSFFDDGFCRPASDPCFRPPSSAVSLFRSDSLIKPLNVKPPTCSSTSYPERDSSRGDAFSIRQHRILLADIRPDHPQPTSLLSSSVPLQTGGKLMALSYSFIFLGICYWLLHKRGRELMRIRDQLALVWLVAVHWWLGTGSSKRASSPTTVAPSNSTSPTVSSPLMTSA
ncbi:hypothetical protein Aperf_G00000069695 [Anoplocephala perfoliata]